MFSLDASLATKDRQEVCSSVQEGETLKMSCPEGMKIRRVERARFGTGMDKCGAIDEVNSCSIGSAKYIIEQECLGKESCQVEAAVENFGSDAHELCIGNRKLDAVYTCH